MAKRGYNSIIKNLTPVYSDETMRAQEIYQERDNNNLPSDILKGDRTNDIESLTENNSRYNPTLGLLEKLAKSAPEIGAPVNIAPGAKQAFEGEAPILSSYYDKRDEITGGGKPPFVVSKAPLNINSIPQEKLDPTLKNTILAKAWKESGSGLGSPVSEISSIVDTQRPINTGSPTSNYVTVGPNGKLTDHVANPNTDVITKGVAAGEWGASSGIMSTLDLLLPNEMLGKNDFIEPIVNYYKTGNTAAQGELQEASNTKLKEVVGQLTTGTIQAIPSAILALVSGGSSLVGKVGAEIGAAEVAANAGKITKIGKALETAVKDLKGNPMFWASFFQMAGPTYDQEKASGASDIKATASALLNGVLGSAIEVSGGLETLKWAEKGWMGLIRTMLEEGGEEVSQYSVQNLINKAVGSDTAKWGSLDPNQNAVFNPGAQAEQGAYGAAIGGILGGGQQIVTSGFNKMNENERAHDSEVFNALGMEPEFTPDGVKNMNETLLSKSEETYNKIMRINNEEMELDDETIADLTTARGIFEKAANNRLVVKSGRKYYGSIVQQIDNIIKSRSTQTVETPTVNGEGAAAPTGNLPKRTRGGNAYFHSSNVDSSPYAELVHAAAKAAGFPALNDEGTLIKVNPKDGTVTFFQVDDFDGREEPIVMGEYRVKPDGTYEQEYYKNKHVLLVDKANFVTDDYTGFDVAAAKEREKGWRNLSKNGNPYSPDAVDADGFFDNETFHKHIEGSDLDWKVIREKEKTEKKAQEEAYWNSPEGIAKKEKWAEEDKERAEKKKVEEQRVKDTDYTGEIFRDEKARQIKVLDRADEDNYNVEYVTTGKRALLQGKYIDHYANDKATHETYEALVYSLINFPDISERKKAAIANYLTKNKNATVAEKAAFLHSQYPNAEFEFYEETGRETNKSGYEVHKKGSTARIHLTWNQLVPVIEELIESGEYMGGVKAEEPKAQEPTTSQGLQKIFEENKEKFLNYYARSNQVEMIKFLKDNFGLDNATWRDVNEIRSLMDKEFKPHDIVELTDDKGKTHMGIIQEIKEGKAKIYVDKLEYHLSFRNPNHKDGPYKVENEYDIFNIALKDIRKPAPISQAQWDEYTKLEDDFKENSESGRYPDIARLAELSGKSVDEVRYFQIERIKKGLQEYLDKGLDIHGDTFRYNENLVDAMPYGHMYSARDMYEKLDSITRGTFQEKKNKRGKTVLVEAEKGEEPSDDEYSDDEYFEAEGEPEEAEEPTTQEPEKAPPTEPKEAPETPYKTYNIVLANEIKYKDHVIVGRSGDKVKVIPARLLEKYKKMTPPEQHMKGFWTDESSLYPSGVPLLKPSEFDIGDIINHQRTSQKYEVIENNYNGMAKLKNVETGQIENWKSNELAFNLTKKNHAAAEARKKAEEQKAPKEITVSKQTEYKEGDTVQFTNSKGETLTGTFKGYAKGGTVYIEVENATGKPGKYYPSLEKVIGKVGGEEVEAEEPAPVEEKAEPKAEEPKADRGSTLAAIFGNAILYDKDTSKPTPKSLFPDRKLQFTIDEKDAIGTPGWLILEKDAPYKLIEAAKPFENDTRLKAPVSLSVDNKITGQYRPVLITDFGGFGKKKTRQVFLVNEKTKHLISVNADWYIYFVKNGIDVIPIDEKVGTPLTLAKYYRPVGVLMPIKTPNLYDEVMECADYLLKNGKLPDRPAYTGIHSPGSQPQGPKWVKPGSIKQFKELIKVGTEFRLARDGEELKRVVAKIQSGNSIKFLDNKRHPVWLTFTAKDMTFTDEGFIFHTPNNGDMVYTYVGGPLNVKNEEKPEKPQEIDEKKPETPIEKEGEKRQDETKKESPKQLIANQVKLMLAKGEKISSQKLFLLADDVFGGTQAQAAYDVKTAFDAMELGVNQFLLKYGKGLKADSMAEARASMDFIASIIELLPTQGYYRNDKMEQYQQFSTPPTIAFLADYVANVSKDDVILEPSAGIGGLVTLPKAWGATVYVNELENDRFDTIQNMPFDRFFNENAEQIDNILPDDVKPTLVIMNPPFSTAAERFGNKRDTTFAKRHIEQALARLEENGRLVAIVGRGMAEEEAAFKSWWSELKEKYNIKANIQIAGENYKKYGTTFDFQMVIIDKNGKTEEPTITGVYEKLDDALIVLEGIRNGRPSIEKTQSEPVVNGGNGTPGGTGRNEPVSTPSNGESTGNVPNNDQRSGTSTERPGNTGNNRPTSNTSDSETVPSNDGIDRGETNAKPDKPNGSTEGKAENTPNNGGRKLGGKSTELEVEDKKPINDIIESEDDTYNVYSSKKLKVKNAQKHPTDLVESAAMSAVDAPDITYVPKIDKSFIESGAISDAQLEAISYAGQSHQKILPSGRRQGFFIGDGTGVGKGREIVGIILDNWNRGKKKVVWISKNKDLLKDAVRDWTDLGNDKSDIFNLGDKFKPDNRIDMKQGILFTTYDTLKSKSTTDPTKTRIRQIVEWLGADFDGVIVFDESHNMGNSLGEAYKKDPAQKALAGIDLQEALPNARIVYASATGATEVTNLAYLLRLGLWGKGTAFENVYNFVNKIGAGGLAAMELVARDMKALGLYTARSLSFKGVEYETLEHELTPIQEAIYDEMSKAWQQILENVEVMLERTNANKNGLAKSRAKGQFYSSLQRFYNQVITSMSVPEVIKDIKAQLAEGNSCIIQLVNTNEAGANRAITKAQTEGLELDDVDMSPTEILVNYLMTSFPIYEYEKYRDDKGVERSRLVVDKNGKPVISKEAAKKRDELIDHVRELKVPEGPMEMIINEFGSDAVAEITGRKRRLVTKDGKKVIEKLTDKTKAADEIDFQGGKKRILIFSDAGGTGRSYHASRSAKNQQRRIHYLLQPGWNASNATQGFGRSHRSNQAVAPLFKLVTTNVAGQKRFTSTIAKRLDQLGALTKGQRDTGSGIFSAKDNLENMIAKDALQQFYRKLARNSFGIDGESVIKKMGLHDKLYDANGSYSENLDVVRDTSKFLNRILAIEVQEQNLVFNNFIQIMEDVFNQAKEAGLVDMGTENFIADKLEIAEELTIRTDESTGAETKYQRIISSKKPSIIEFEYLQNFYSKFIGLVRLKDSNEVRAVYQLANKTLNSGDVVNCYRLVSPVYEMPNATYIQATMDQKTEPLPKKQWESEWQKQIEKAPEYLDETMHLLTGVLLPVWNRLPQEVARVRRVMDKKGSIQLLGRIIPADKIDGVLFGFNARRKREVYTSEQIYEKIMKDNMTVSLEDQRQKLVRRRVSGENRIEIIGDNAFYYPGKVKGVFSEKISAKYRYFITTEKAAAKAAIDEIVRGNPVSSISKNVSEDEDGIKAAYGITAPKETSLAGTFYVPQNGQQYRNNLIIFKSTNGKLKSVGEITRKLSKDMSVPITSTRFRRRGKLGIYNTKYHQIETKYYNTIGVVGHELGHHLDQKYGLVKFYKKELNEMVKKFPADFFVKYKDEKDHPGEAVADFMKLYLTDIYGAYEFGELSNGRNFVDIFEDLLDEADKKILTEARADIATFLGSDIQERFKTTIVKHDAKKPLMQRTVELLKKDGRFKLYVKIVNAFEGFKTVDEAVEDYTGKKIAPKDSVELKAFQTLRADVLTNFITLGKLVTPQGEIIGEGFQSILKAIKKGEHDDFDAYLKMVHALEWKAQGKQVFSKDFSFEEIRHAIKAYETQYPHFADTAQNLYDWWDTFCQTWLVDTGLMEQSVYDMLREMYPHYVPNFRAKSTDDAVGYGVKRAQSKFSNIHTPMRRASEKGNDMDTYSATQSMVVEIDRYVKTVLRRDVLLTLHKNYENNDYAEVMGMFMRRVGPEMEKNVFNAMQLKMNMNGELFNEEFNKLSKEEQAAFEKKPITEQIALMNEWGKIDLVDSVIDNYITYFTPKKISTDDHIVTVTDKGHTYFYEIMDTEGFGQYLLTALQNVEPKQLDGVVKILANLKRMLTVLTTGGNPIFGLTSNIWRDLQQAYILGSYNNPISYSWEIFKAIRSIAQKDEIYMKYKAIGGGYESPIGADAHSLKKTMRKLLPGEYGGVGNTIGKAIDAIEAFNNVIETAPRLVEFKHFYEQGGDNYESLLQAGYKSADVTLNFSRHGSMSTLSAVIPFFNAGIQGLDKLYRSGIKDKAEFKSRFIKALALISMLSIAQALAYADDDDYDDLPDFYKDNYWLIKYDAGKFIRIPKPRELGVLFGATFDRAIQEYLHSEDDNGMALVEAFKQNFMMPVRWVLAPVVDVWANKSWSGAPIVPQRDENLSLPGYYADQYDDTTSRLAVGIAWAMNKIHFDGALGTFASPRNIDYILKQYSGIAGQLLLPPLTPTSEGIFGLKEGLERKVTVDTLYSNRYVDEYYEIYAKLEGSQERFERHNVKDKNYNDEWRLTFGRNSRGTKEVSGLSNYWKEIREINADDRLTSKQKQEKSEAVREKLNALAEKIVKEYKAKTK